MVASSPSPASALPGDATPGISKAGSPAATVPGGTITYTINYTCSNNSNTPPVDGCDGAVLSDPLPTFIDVYGETVPVEVVSSPGTTVFPLLTVVTDDPAYPQGVLRGTAGTWNPGVSGAITITVRVPKGVVPVGQTTLTNTAFITDAEKPAFRQDTEPVQTLVNVNPPDWAISKLGPAENTRMNRDYEWIVSVCGPATSALWPVYEITDTLPPGFQFVEAEHGGSYTDDPGAVPADNISDGAGTITWTFDATNRPPLTDDGCFRTTITGRFPSGYVSPVPDADHPNDDNVGGAHKLNEVTGIGSDGAGSEGTLGEATWESILVAPTFGSAGTDKRFSDAQNGDNFYATTGEVGVFNLSATIDSDFPLDYAVLTDGRWRFQNGATDTNGTGMPESFTATAVVPGTWNGGITARIEGSDDNFQSDIRLIAADVASGAPQMTLADTYRSIRWVWGAPGGDDVIPGNFEAVGQKIIGDLGVPEDDFGLYTNFSQFHVELDGTARADVEDSDQYVLETPSPLARIDKSVADSNRLPGQSTTYTITVRNNADATGPLTDPEVTDCVPEHFVLQGTPTVGAGWTIDPTPAPCQTTGPDGQLHAGTPLHFLYTGVLQPGQAAPPISYNVQVSPSDPGPVAEFGTYVNTAFVTPSGGGSFGHCANTNPVCGDTASVTVPPTVELASRKCVSGVLDEGVFRPNPDCDAADPAQTIAQTLPGNRIEWRLELQNVGNTSANNIDFIDIFPHVGDRAVITTSNGELNPRGSEFTPYLVSEIVAPAGWTVFYSTSTNPCRPEVGGPTQNCEPANWTSTLDPLLLPTYRSVKLHFDDVLDFGETAEFTWEMRAPVTDITYDENGDESPDPYEFLDDGDGNCGAFVPPTDPTHCPRAVNSFAYGADATGLGNVPAPARLFAEPPQVEVRVTDPPPPHAIGDRVWFDRNFDGIQSTNLTDEPGIAGILVELVDAVTGTVIDTTYTDQNGNYLFNGDSDGLPTGSYIVRFYKPSGWWVSPQDVTGAGDQNTANTNDDSDVPPTGTDAGTPGVTYHDTVAVQLGDPDEIDLTWDMGLWRPLPGIDLLKVTKDAAWPDSAAGDGVTILRGRPVEWIYTMRNTGNTRLDGVTLSDDRLPAATFTCREWDPVAQVEGDPVTLPATLLRGEELRCRTTGTAQSTNYNNTGTVVGTVVTDTGEPAGPGPVGFPPSPPTVTDTDPSDYVNGRYDLALAKTVGTLDLATGNVTFTITVRNEGTVPSGEYTITDVLPTGVSVVSTSPSATVNGSTLTWTRSGLASNSNHTFTINAHVADYLLRPYRNYAEISDDSADLVVTGGVPTPAPNGDWDSDPDADIANDSSDYGPVGTPNASVDNANITEAGSSAFPNSGDDPGDGQDDADIADINPQITYDLALAKATAVTPVPAGSNPSFNVRVYNQGNVPSGPVVVRDQLPTGLSFTTTGSSSGCSAIANDQVECAIANIQPSESVLLTIATTIDTVVVDGQTIVDYSTAPWRNWAEIASDSAQELYAVADADSQPEGDENDGIGLDETLPGDQYIGVPTAGTAYVGASTGDEDDNDDDIATTAVRYDLALAKVAAAPDLAAGTVAYTITIANQGSVPSGAYTVADVLPAGLQLAPSPAPTPGAPSVNGSTLTWTLPNLDPGAQQTITYTATIDDYTLQPFRNIAEITTDSAEELYNVADVDSTPDTNTGNDTGAGTYDTPGIDNTGPGAIDQAGVAADPEDDADIANVPLGVTYDLALAKVAAVSTIGLGESPVFQVRVYNQGNVQSEQVVVRDQLPTGLSYDDAGSTDGCAPAADNQVLCTVDNIAPGESVLLTIATTIDGTPDNFGTAPWRNWAEIDSDSGISTYGVADPDSDPDTEEDNGIGADDELPGDPYIDVPTAGEQYTPPTGDDEDDNDAAEVTSSVLYDLALAKTADVTDLVQGTSPVITYTITVANQGNVPSGSYTVIDALPAGVTFVSASSNGENLGDGTVRWVGTSLIPGATATYTLEVEITDFTQRPFRNVAEISEDSASELYGLADIDSTPDSDRTNDNPGNGLSDDGYGPVGDSDPLADNLDIDDAGEDLDGDDDADVADVNLPLTDAYDLALAKTADAAVTTYNGTITYTITVQNQGLVDSREFTVTDVVPAGLEAIDTSHDGVLLGGTVTWTIANLEPAESLELSFTARITDITLRPFRNVAEITDDSADYYTVDGDAIEDHDSDPDTDPTNDTGSGTYDTPGVDNVGEDAIDQAGVLPDPEDDADIADVDVDVQYDLRLIKTGPPEMDPLGTVTFTVTVDNQGTVPSGLYTVTDAIPAGMELVSASDGGVADGAGNVVWTDLPGIDPDTAPVVLTVTMRIVDLSQRPFTNFAEITDDSADTYSQPGGPTVTDQDSAPGDDPTSEADNTELEQAGAAGDPSDETFDDEDIAVVSTDVIYDLALAKTVNTPSITIDGSATFTVIVRNQGNVPSGPFTVTDTLPDGLTAGAISDGGSLAGNTITWTLELAPGDTKDLTIAVTVSDITKRPFRNVAEITDDSSELYSIDGDEVVDQDSVPGDEPSNEADNGSIDDAGIGDDGMFDDEDPAVLNADVRYDLDLIKRLPAGQRFRQGDTVRFEIVVANQGNVPSGAYTVQDVLPSGLGFVSASDGGTASGSTVTWANLPSLAPGASVVLSVDVRMDDVTQPAYVNVAEITADSSGIYSTPTETVTDVDSTPDTDPANDPLVDTDDIANTPAGDEDDHDRALLDVAQVAVDNLAPTPPTPPTQPTAPPATVPDPGELPRTGGNSIPLVLLAGIALLAGFALMLVRRRTTQSSKPQPR